MAEYFSIFGPDSIQYLVWYSLRGWILWPQIIPFFALSTIRLSLQRFAIRFDDESRSETSLRRNLDETKAYWVRFTKVKTRLSLLFWLPLFQWTSNDSHCKENSFVTLQPELGWKVTEVDILLINLMFNNCPLINNTYLC